MLNPKHGKWADVKCLGNLETKKRPNLWIIGIENGNDLENIFTIIIDVNLPNLKEDVPIKVF